MYHTPWHPTLDAVSQGLGVEELRSLEVEKNLQTPLLAGEGGVVLPSLDGEDVVSATGGSATFSLRSPSPLRGEAERSSDEGGY